MFHVYVFFQSGLTRTEFLRLLAILVQVLKLMYVASTTVAAVTLKMVCVQSISLCACRIDRWSWSSCRSHLCGSYQNHLGNDRHDLKSASLRHSGAYCHHRFGHL